MDEINTEHTTEPSLAPQAVAETDLPLTLDIPEAVDETIDILRFRLDEHTRELGRRQVALIKAQLAERAARRAA